MKRIDAGYYAGTFVSTMPQTGFGNYILAFNRSIENGPVINAELKGIFDPIHWTGFQWRHPYNQIYFKIRCCVGDGVMLKHCGIFQKSFKRCRKKNLCVSLRNLVIDAATKRAQNIGVLVPADWPTEFMY